MNISIDLPEVTDLKPRITVVGLGGAGCNAVNNMIATGLDGVEFIAANTDAQALAHSSAEHQIQLGTELTEGLGAGAKPEIGRDAAEEAADEIRAQLQGSHMVFLAAGMGGGTGTGAVSVFARIARELGILTVAIVSKPFHFEGSRRMRTAETGIEELRDVVDTLIVIPNQNLFRLANEKTTFAEAFVLADQVLYSGIACIVDLIVKDGLINLDFADVKAIMQGMGTAMMGTGEAVGENRATRAAEEAISNPLLDEISLRGARGLLISIIGGRNLTLFEVDEAASRVKQEADHDANIIVGASFEDDMDEKIRVSIVASGLPGSRIPSQVPTGSASQSSPSHAWITKPQANASSAPYASASDGSADPDLQNSETTTDQIYGLEDDRSRSGDTAASESDDIEEGGRADAPPKLPTAIEQELQNDPPDPYLGNTSVDEFARALSEVIGTVDDNEEAASERQSRSWQSPDGVVIKDGFQPATASPPPLLPTGVNHDTTQSQSGFTPNGPADLPRRVPDISEFPEIVQQQYLSQSNEPADQGTKPLVGMPGILRRLTGFGRASEQPNDSPQTESVDNWSSNDRPQAGNNHDDESTDQPGMRRTGRS